MFGLETCLACQAVGHDAVENKCVAVCLKYLVKSKAMCSLCESDMRGLSRDCCVAGIMYILYCHVRVV